MRATSTAVCSTPSGSTSKKVDRKAVPVSLKGMKCPREQQAGTANNHEGVMNNTKDLPAILSTADAARALNLRPQTLRRWACMGDGPISPTRINKRLAWRVDDLRRIIEGEAQQGGKAA